VERSGSVEHTSLDLLNWDEIDMSLRFFPREDASSGSENTLPSDHSASSGVAPELVHTQEEWCPVFSEEEETMLNTAIQNIANDDVDMDALLASIDVDIGPEEFLMS
jgi:hypothetical protein